MNSSAETIDIGRMRILSEFPVRYENDEDRLIPHLANIEKCLIGALGNLIILAVLVRGNGNLSFQVAFEKENIPIVAGKILEAINNPDETNPEIIEKGQDKLMIGVQSNFPHNLLAPFSRIFIKNLRPVVNQGQNLDQSYWDLSLPVKSAQILSNELNSLTVENK